eukprot:6005041-Pyramimonas_sp.AAC.1
MRPRRVRQPLEGGYALSYPNPCSSLDSTSRALRFDFGVAEAVIEGTTRTSCISSLRTNEMSPMETGPLGKNKVFPNQFTTESEPGRLSAAYYD